jgi:RHH-type rel operon transcriptional repressor/antitoxin RelB
MRYTRIARLLCWPYGSHNLSKSDWKSLPDAQGRTKSFYAREAILRHLEDLEDLYLAERALDRIRNGEDVPLPLDEVVKRHCVDQ